MNIWVNGCFDILHVGHIKLLDYAKHLKDPKSKYRRKNRLIVGIDSDSRVKELKGGDRPINNQDDRQSMLEALRFVDDVVIYNNEEEMCKYISRYCIDYMVIGEDYKDKRVVCRECSENDVVFYPKDENSSTNVIEKIKKL
jgi:D-beta-D-heptose 7-phosphate kinase/D-beta-D-heptose 1-phosphate adenosyltransferase